MNIIALALTVVLAAACGKTPQGENNGNGGNNNGNNGGSGQTTEQVRYEKFMMPAAVRVIGASRSTSAWFLASHRH